METARLRFRPLTWDDLPFFVSLHGDMRVARYLATGKPRSEEETREWLGKVLAWRAGDATGHQGAVLKADGRLVGRSGLQWFEMEVGAERPRIFFGPGSAPPEIKTERTLEVGYTFHPDTWGQGLATEAARLMRDEGFRRGEQRIMAVIHAENTPSIRVAEKNGFSHRGELDYSGRIFRRYEITRAEWERIAKG